MNNIRDKFEEVLNNCVLETQCMLEYDEATTRDIAHFIWQAATEQSQKEIAEKDARIAELELENKQAKEAIAILNDGKPLGEIVGLHTAQLLLIKFEALQAREKVLVEALDKADKFIGELNFSLDRDVGLYSIEQALANVNNEKKG